MWAQPHRIICYIESSKNESALVTYIRVSCGFLLSYLYVYEDDNAIYTSCSSYIWQPYIEQSTKEKEKEKERINREMAAYNEQQKMQSRSEYQPCLPETSTGDYHVSLETGSAANEILLPDKPMDPFNACLMEIANQLHQQMDWDFYGHFDMSI